MFWKENEELISVIVPVYNVSEYVEKCIESLINQTYRNIEIIIINDGSTDNSDIKCLQLSKKDNRIVFINKLNEKVGTTRNWGIQISRGKYITFVDADDYVECDYIEKLYNAISGNDADIAFCNYYRVYNDKIIPTYNEVVNTNNYNDLLMNCSPAVWGKIYRKSIFIENDLIMTSNYHEDMELFPKLLLYANKIVRVKECLYYYIIERSGNLHSNNEAKIKYFRINSENIIEYFKEKNLFKEYYNGLRAYITRAFLRRFYINSDKKILISNITKDIYEDALNILINYFPDIKETKTSSFLICGSTVLRNFVSEINPYSSFFSGEYLRRFNFSSIISILSNYTEVDTDLVTCDNEYRKQMLLNDINKTFIREIADYKDKKILIDFMEERYDIVKYKNTYYTFTENFKNTELAKKMDLKILRLDSPERRNLWEKSCEKFINILKENFKMKDIYLVRNYVYDGMRDYASDLEVDKINCILEYYYNFFEEHAEGINIYPNIR